MRVANRLFLAVVPAVLGVLAMAALAYWGQRGRQVPDALLLVGLLAALASLALAWHNTRYVARRIDALSAGQAADATGADELGTIARRLAEAGRRGETREAAAESLVREYAALLSGAAGELERRLDEVRLPLHILLSSPFGELNENQEEILGSAQVAADAAHEELRTIARIVELDAGRVESRPRPVRPRDLLAPVLAAVEERVGAAGATFTADVPPTLPHVRVDPEHAREALSLILNRLASRIVPGASLALVADHAERGTVRLLVHDASLADGERFSLAQRLLALQGARTATRAGMLEVVFGGAEPHGPPTGADAPS